MNPKARRRNGPGALETIETAVHLLRIAPAGTLAAYHLGALPFVLGLLFFWADMSRNPFATQHAAAVSLGMAGLFLWLKFWQAVFAQRLRAQLSGEDPPPLTVARAAKMFLTQTAVQPTALFVLPLALIPAGPCLIGDGGGFEDEGPMHRVTLPTFQIGIYPVTNREFALFLDEIGHPKPRYWSDPRFNNPSHPVVGVTWHDAVAYCRWLTARLAAAGQLEPGQVVRLPTEFEWEKAASWDHRREIKLRYPWGYDWDCARANTADGRGAWVTAPVGCYPGGVSPYGLHDCLGNVWEWTANSYGSYPGTSRPYHEPGSYVLRGSSCVLEPTNVRCTYRSRLPASYWRYHLGFRVVVARPLPEEA